MQLPLKPKILPVPLALILIPLVLISFSFEWSAYGRKSLNTVVVGSQSSTPTPSPPPSEISVDVVPAKEDKQPASELRIDRILDQAYGTKDIDCDGVENRRDNCPSAFNPRQEDRNKDGVGDACDVKTGGDADLQDWRCDYDGDGILDRDDNCILVCNPNQKDGDKDGVGDACDLKVNPRFRRIAPCKKPKVAGKTFKVDQRTENP